MERHAIVELAERLVAQEELLLQGVAVGDIPAEVLEAWGQSHGGQLLDVLRKMTEATVEALHEMERLGIHALDA